MFCDRSRKIAKQPMKTLFDANQPYQLDAVAAVVDY